MVTKCSYCKTCDNVNDCIANGRLVEELRCTTFDEYGNFDVGMMRPMLLCIRDLKPSEIKRKSFKCNHFETFDKLDELPPKDKIIGEIVRNTVSITGEKFLTRIIEYIE